MKRLATTLVLVLLSIAVLGGQNESEAMKTLIKALGSQRDVRATMIQTRSDGDSTITVSVQIVPRKGIAAKVIKPLIYAGMVSYDNGDVWKNYDPQLDLLRIEPSPAKFHLDVDFRKKLIEKNYTVTMEREALVAGRRASVVFLKPKSSDVARRRLYIDEENSLILRYMVEEPDGRTVMAVDTKTVDLTSRIDVSEYERLGDGAAKTEKAWGPIEVSRPSGAVRYTGFAPVMPAALPSGLTTQAIHVVGSAKRSFVGIRLTDGMAVVTVYVWKQKDGESASEEPFGGSCDARGGGDVKVKVVGEVSSSLKGDLARRYASGYSGPTVMPGTDPGPRHVQDKRSTGGGFGAERPKLVIDNEQ